MKVVHTITRANKPTKHHERMSFKIANELHRQMFKTRTGAERKLAVRKCACGAWHLGSRDSRSIGKQKDVARMCRDCFRVKYGKGKPLSHRLLKPAEIEAWKRYYEATGCKVYTVPVESL